MCIAMHLGMKFNPTWLAAVALCALGGGGCIITTHTDSSPPPPPAPPVTTSGPLSVDEMTASMSAQSDGSSVKVYAALLSASNFIVLDPGDYFQATLAGDTVVMTREPTSDSTVHYVATFPMQSAAAQVVVSFSRPPGKNGAPYSQVTLASPFEITSVAPVSFHRGDVLSMALSSPAPEFRTDTFRLQFEGSCLADISTHEYPLVLSADGTAEFDTSPLVFSDEENGPRMTPLSCDVTIHVRDESGGQVDSAFHRGVAGSIDSMPGVQQRLMSSYVVRAD
jgi:hypothetical protein